jgi:hypothetical protein
MGDYIGNHNIPAVKGRRNYIQLSDGRDDFMVNENLYATSNGSISGHISGSGTATEMAYFTGPETIASTPALDASVWTTQLFLAEGTEFLPTLSFQGDTGTGIYKPSPNAVDFTINGSKIIRASQNSNVSVGSGTANRPMFNFGLSGVDTNTGMFQSSEDIIGLSTGNDQKVTIRAAGVLGPVGTIDGLNVGTSGASVSAGIRRLSEVAANSWEDGDMGNSAALIFTPSDFENGDDPGPTPPDPPIQISSSQGDPAAAGSRWYGAISTVAIVSAQKVIPKGFIINGGKGVNSIIELYTPSVSIINTTCYVSVQSVDIDGSTVLDNLLSSTTFSSNFETSLNTIIVPIIGDGKKIITIYWDTGGVPLTAANSLAGARITMKRI